MPFLLSVSYKSGLSMCALKARQISSIKFVNFQHLHRTPFLFSFQAVLSYFQSKSNKFLSFSRIQSFWISTPVPVSHEVLSDQSLVGYLLCLYRAMRELQSSLFTSFSQRQTYPICLTLTVCLGRF